MNAYPDGYVTVVHCRRMCPGRHEKEYALMSFGGQGPGHMTTRTTAHLSVVCEPGSYAERKRPQGRADVERVFGRTSGFCKFPARQCCVHIASLWWPASPGNWPNGSEGAVTAGDASSDLIADVVSIGYGPNGSFPWSGRAPCADRPAPGRLTAVIPDEERDSEAQSGTSEAQQFFVEGAARFVAHQAAHGTSKGKAPPELLEAENLCREAGARTAWRLPLYQAVVRGPSAVGDLGAL